MRPLPFVLLSVTVLLLAITGQASAQTALQFVAIAPCRVVDTRGTNGPFGGPPIPSNGTRSFALPDNSACNIPSDAAAYSLNVTVVPLTGSLDYLTVWPAGETQPLVSTMNSYDGRLKANAAIVPAGTGGAVSVFATDTTEVILDISGYFIPSNSSTLAFYPLTPCRVADTRGGEPLQPRVAQNFAVAGVCNIPSSAKAFSLNFTAVPYHGQPLGYLTVWPKGQSQPGTSTLNAPTGTITANAAIVQSGTGGEISAYAYNETDLIIDVNGYFAAPGGAAELNLYTLTPCRVLDTRPHAFQGARAVPIAGNPCSVPPGAGAYVVNATAVPQGPLGFLTLWPDGESMPVASTLNAIDGAVTSNMAIVPTLNGSIDAYNSDASNLIVDIFSYLAPPPVTNATLDGHFAIAFTGYKNGNPIVMAGAVVADGNGHLTSGLLDVNDGNGESLSGHNVVPQTLAAGSVYSLTSSGQGTMTIVTNAATYQFSIDIAASACSPNSQSLSTCGRLIQRDSAHPQSYGSGVLKVQNAQYFPLDSFFPGTFTLQISGTDPAGNRYAAAAALGTNTFTLVDIDCSSSPGGTGWGLDGCPADINDNGSAAYDPIKGSFSSTIDQNTGRGNFVNLTFPSDPTQRCSSTVCSFAFYIIDRSQMILISADPIAKPANLTLWTAVRQQPPSGGWTFNSLRGVNVAELNALDPNGGSPVPAVTAGLLTGNGSASATFQSDQNQGGTMSHQSTSGTLAIDSSGQQTGKVTLNGFSQLGSSAALYLSAPNTGFIVASDVSVTAGTIEAQSGSSFGDASLIGNYAGGTVPPASMTVTNSVTSMIADGSGNIGATQQTSGPNGPGQDSLTLTYQVDATGRAVVNQNGNLYGIFYVVSPNKVVLLPVGPAPDQTILASGPTN